ncbi:MAG: hypothetical protein ACOYMF_08915 [Bacteroidales bacterium]
MKKQIVIYSTIVLFLAGCAKENELKKSVMIYDTEYTDLPAYSEWGYNTFGAYYDREVFISNDITVPAKVIVSNNKMSFVLNGQKGAAYYYDFKEMALTFTITGFLPEDYTNLIVFNDTILDLTNPAYQVKVTLDTIEYTANILSGELTFKRAQNLFVDKRQIEVILSGYFDFKAKINEEPVTISNGRFDVGISPDNFYFY